MDIMRCSKFNDKDRNIQMEWISFRFGHFKQYQTHVFIAVYVLDAWKTSILRK